MGTIREKKGYEMGQGTLPTWSELAKSIVAGSIYEHYKKKRYKIVGVARHTETLEELVVYLALYGEGELWVRPLAMFLENIFVEGSLQPRFRAL